MQQIGGWFHAKHGIGIWGDVKLHRVRGAGRGHHRTPTHAGSDVSMQVATNDQFDLRVSVQEFFSRDAANVAWITHAFAQAKALQAKAMVFAFQADVFESKSRWEDFPAHSGFRRSVGETLLPLAAQSNMPVLVIHGDSHEFKFDQAFQWQKKPMSSVYRLVVPGAQDVRAVMVSVDTTRPSVFQVKLISPRP